MLGAGYFLKIAEINFQQEKPICPNLKNKFPVTWPFHRLPRPLCDVKRLTCGKSRLPPSCNHRKHFFIIPNKRPGDLFNFRGPSGGVLITVTISTKLIHFRQKYQESFNMAAFPLHQLIHLGHLEIHITL